jgi:regulator of RNase E activity RraB
MTIRPEDLPNDADGDALRRILAHGSDLSKLMEIDYAVAVPDETAAHRVALAAEKAGFRARVRQDEESHSWTCYCSKTMIASHDNLLKDQKLLDDLSEPFGGYSDGWGTFGNVPGNQP